MSSLKRQKPNKVALIGDANVGKTCIIERLIKKSFGNTKSTIGACNENITINNINLDIWDTAGQERFRSMIPMYYKGAKAIIICFDITEYNSFEGAKKWLNEIENFSKNTEIFLVGNKCDLDNLRKVSFDVSNNFAESKGLYFIETSAKNNINVEKLFEDVAEKIKNMKISYDDKIDIKNDKGDYNDNDNGCGCL